MEKSITSAVAMPLLPPRTQFVDPDVFLAEMTSRRELLRCDEDGATIRGLLDPSTGRRILVEEERLLNARETG